MCSVGVIPHTLPFIDFNTAIRTFRHALSLDERRAKFKPLYYGGGATTVKTVAMGMTVGAVGGAQVTLDVEEAWFADVKEVWFAGCHCGACFLRVSCVITCTHGARTGIPPLSFPTIH